MRSYRSVRRLPCAVASVLFVLGGGAIRPARAQSFPPQSPWQALSCGAAPMTDARRDVPAFFDDRDVVGSADAPAGFFAWDPTYLYLQLRVDADPNAPGKLAVSSWGFEFSTDGDPATYEYLIVLNGGASAVEVYRNSSTTLPDSPADPSPAPPALSYPFASNARVTEAADSRFGDNPDYLVSLAVPWKDLETIGLLPTTPALIWAGTSSVGNALDGDLACHDGTAGPAQLSAVGGGVRIVIDVVADTDGDGYPDWYEVRFGTDPTSAASHPDGPPPPVGPVGPIGVPVVEGGGGCQIGGGAGGGLVVVLLMLAAIPRARRRRR